MHIIFSQPSTFFWTHTNIHQAKTDDINLTEASDIVDDREEITQMWEKAEDLENSEVKRLKDQRQQLTENRLAVGEVFSNMDQLYDEWDDLLKDLERGETVYAPSDNPRKRKASPMAKKSKKKAQASFSQDDDMDDFIVDDDAESDARSDTEDSDCQIINDNEIEPVEITHRVPLTKDDISKKLEEIKAKKTNARKERAELGKRIEAVKQAQKENSSKIAAFHSKIAARCIKGRNIISRAAIQEDFAQGIKELDQENAIEEDEEGFDPEVDIRDYDMGKL
jgi:hypothetical protein